MRPNFTLSLSFSGIQLLHRQGASWGLIGDVDLSTEDLSGDLAALLDKARAFSDGQIETKLIIPDEQIKYLTVDVSGLEKDAVQSAVLSALDGATPYAIDELEFDFANEGGNVHIAAVAKETLQEAEAFASEHGFGPVGFVAAPAVSAFPKEPNFGLSELAKSHGKTSFEADETIVVSSGAAILPQPTEPEPAAPEPVAPEPAAAEPEAPPAPLPGFSSRRAAPEESAKQPTVTAPKVDTTEPAASAQGQPRLDGVQRNTPQETNALPEVAAPTTTPPEPVQAPEITGKSEVALDEQQVAANLEALRPGAAAGDAELDDIPPMPAGFAAAPRPNALHGAADGAPIADLRAPAIGMPSLAEETPEKQPNEATAKAAALAGAAGGAALKGARALFKKRAKPEPEPEIEAAREEEKQRMTVFGARKPKKKAEPVSIGGKPRFLGLILTAILLLFLVSVAAWASVFLDDGLARFFGGSDRTRAIAQLPDPAGPAQNEDAIELAALDTGVDDIAIDDLPAEQGGLTQVAPTPPAITPEEAAAKYAATGIWLATPVQPANPPRISQDDVYPASIDRRITGQDAFALEPLSQPRDVAPTGLAAPPPQGTEFAFDENGLVPATPDGALTPEGALVFQGRPAVVPPAIPERLRTAALTPEVAPEATAPEPEITATSRPRARPEGLVENTERTQLGGKTRSELAKLRPKLRPQVAKKVEETVAAEAPATELAVASSRKPSLRPRNFARIVTRAQKQAAREPAQQATQVAAVAPRTVTPRIPSKASVAKTATVKNAINLSRVNLIGVYGKPSSRRALVRLSSGRYKKVKVGDRVDGGRVSAIGEAQLIYTKSGRNVTLRMPKG